MSRHYAVVSVCFGSIIFKETGVSCFSHSFIFHLVIIVKNKASIFESCESLWICKAVQRASTFIFANIFAVKLSEVQDHQVYLQIQSPQAHLNNSKLDREDQGPEEDSSKA